MRPLLLKVGVAVSLSVAGYLYSRLCCRSRPRRRDHLPHAAPAGLDEGRRELCGGGGLKDEILLLQCEDDARSNYVANGAATGIMSAAAAAADGLSPQSKISGDEEEEPAAGLDDMAALEPAPLLKRSAPDSKNADVVAEPEVVILLKSLVRSLQERERSRPEIMEQENSSAAMETPDDDFRITLKIESLEAENRRLAADHRETKGELESARAKVRRLRRRLKSESRRAKERVAVLQRRAAAMQDVERRWGEEEAERRLARVKDLEGEVAELRRVNSKLAMENSDMARKLESTQSLASSGLPSLEAIMAATEESNSQLRQKNEELTKQLEQLQTDHCADVEELVYLRWVNACLRYELRNHQPPPGKTVLARDLSRTPSPESEHRVKQLILEYANANEKSISATEHFDSETCSASSEASYGDHPEDVAPVEVISGAFPMKSSGGGGVSSSGKKKFFTKLKSLVLGKESKGRRRKFEQYSPAGGSPTVSGGSSSARRAISPSASSFDEMVAAGRSSCDSPASWTAPPDDAEAGDHGRRDGGSPPTRTCLARV